MVDPRSRPFALRSLLPGARSPKAGGMSRRARLAALGEDALPAARRRRIVDALPDVGAAPHALGTELRQLLVHKPGACGGPVCSNVILFTCVQPAPAYSPFKLSRPGSPWGS